MKFLNVMFQIKDAEHVRAVELVVSMRRCRAGAEHVRGAGLVLSMQTCRAGAEHAEVQDRLVLSSQRCRAGAEAEMHILK